MEKFPKAFRRFESQVNIRDAETFRQLEMMFEEWAGYKWKPTYLQLEALKREAMKRGISTGYVRKERRFSSSYESYSVWTTRTRTSSISNV